MTSLIMWAGIAAVICGFSFVTGDMRPVVTMFVVSVLLPDDLFSAEG